MTQNQLRILAPTRYPWTFNGPRFSRHTIKRRAFVPFNKIPVTAFADRLDGVTLLNPFPLQRFDLIHAFNRIPLFSSTPYIIGFESHLPRFHAGYDSPMFRQISQYIASPRCKGIFPFSEAAKRIFTNQNQRFEWFDALIQKTKVRYPNIIIPDQPDAFAWDDNAPLKLVFIGNHFARKGGCVCVHIAEMAHMEGVPLEMHIISDLTVNSWTDPSNSAFFDPYKHKITSLPNIIYHGNLANQDVIDLVSTAHFVMLPTLSDTFGFSVIEAMSCYTPAIATTQGALPEFLEDNVNSILLPLECDEFGTWMKMDYGERHTRQYERMFEDEMRFLADTAYKRLKNTMSSPKKYMAMRGHAYKTAKENFCAHDASDFWDGVYDRVLS